MKLGVPLDINCGVRRAANVNPTYSYIGTDGTTTCDQNRNPTRTLAVRISPCLFVVAAQGAHPTHPTTHTHTHTHAHTEHHPHHALRQPRHGQRR